MRFRTNDVLLGTLGAGVRICGVSNSPARMEQLPGWNNYLGSILRLGWNNYLDGTTTWVRTCVLRPLGHSLYQLSYVEHLLIHPGEANGPNSNTAPLPGGRRVHLGSACWGGRRCASPLSGRPRGVGGRASGGSSLLVSRAAAAPFIWSLVLYFRFCIVSRPLASRGAPERHVYCCWLRARNRLFLIRNQAYYTRTPSGGTLGACATRQGGVGGGRASSPERLAARSRGVKRVALRHSRAGGIDSRGAKARVDH